MNSKESAIMLISSLDEEVLKKLKKIWKNTPTEVDNCEDNRMFFYNSNVLTAHRDFYYKSLKINRKRNYQSRISDISLFAEIGIAQIEDSTIVDEVFQCDEFLLFKNKEVREYVVNQNAKLMHGGVVNSCYQSTTYELNLTNYVRIAKSSLVELQPKAFTSENTKKLLKKFELKINEIIGADFQLVKASLLINSPDRYYNNQHYGSIVQIDGIYERIGDSVIICSIPIDGNENVKVSFIPNSHFGQTRDDDLIDEKIGVELTLSKHAILIIHGLLQFSESSYKMLNYRLRLYLCKKDIAIRYNEVICKYLLDRINHSKFFHTGELISKAENEYVMQNRTESHMSYQKLTEAVRDKTNKEILYLLNNESRLILHVEEEERLLTNKKSKFESLIIANNDKSFIQQSVVDELIINDRKEVSYRYDSCCETILLYDLNTECLETSSEETIINLVVEEESSIIITNNDDKSLIQQSAVEPSCDNNKEELFNEFSAGEEVFYSALNKEEESIQLKNNCLIN